MTAEHRGASPQILVTRAEEVTGERWGDYAAAVERAGGAAEPVDLDDFQGAGEIEFDGLLVTAGVDIDPARYGEARSSRVIETNPRRDEFEEALIREALRRDRPILAICRGAQLLNTMRGGRLIQHLEQREPHRARRGPDGISIVSGWHEVRVASGTLLERVTDERDLRVNSRHHQAIPADGVPPGLVATAHAPDGIVEAVEDPSARWALGVQWHPELAEMWQDPALAAGSTRLFAAFVAACREGAAAET